MPPLPSGRRNDSMHAPLFSESHSNRHPSSLLPTASIRLLLQRRSHLLSFLHQVECETLKLQGATCELIQQELSPARYGAGYVG